MKRILLATLIGLTFTTTVNAQETEAEKSAARLATLFAAISTEGGTTAKDGAGEIEASMLTASAIWKASEYFNKKIMEITKQTKVDVLVLTDQQSVNFSGYISAQRQLKLFENRFMNLGNLEGIKNTCKPKFDAPGGAAPVALTALSGFVGAIRQKTELAKVSVTATSSMLAKAVAGNMPKDATAILPDNMPTPDLATSKFATQLVSVETSDACWRGILSTLKADPKKPHIALAIAAIKTTTEDFKSFNESLSKIDEKGQSLFVQAVSLESLITKQPHALRLSVDAAGGTSILNNNFLTLFGFNALKITGGTVISYSYLNGSTITSGLIVCPTKVASLGSVHRGQLASKDCIDKPGSEAKAPKKSIIQDIR